MNVIDKKSFLNRFSLVDSSIVSSIYDKVVLAQKTNKTIYTGEFYHT